MGSEIQKKPAQTELMGFIESKRSEFAKLVERTVGVDRFLRVAMTTINRSEALRSCTPISLLAALMDAAQLGLEVGGPLQEGWLIPYKGEATFQPGYRGLISLLIEHRLVKKIEARLVYEQDEFRVEYGLEPRIIHAPHVSDDRGKLVAVYAVAWLANGEVQFDVLAPADVERARKSSRSSGSVWVAHEGEMWRKTAVKRLIKYLRLKAPGGVPIPALAKALELEEADFDDHAVDVKPAYQDARKMSLGRGKIIDHEIGVKYENEGAELDGPPDAKEDET